MATTDDLVETTSDDSNLDHSQFCESHGTEQFRRVFGDDNDIAHWYVKCDSITRLQKVSAGDRVDVLRLGFDHLAGVETV